MKKTLLSVCTLLLLVACGGVKKTQEALNSGNYETAMNKAMVELAENKSKKGHQPYILMLEEAYAKHSSRELSQIEFLKADGNPANYEAIYTKLMNLRKLQERIRPLLPLYIEDEGRDAEFQFKNYNKRILAVKAKLSEYLYNNASELLANATFKQDYRAAYEDFAYLNKINPNFRDVKEKMELAHERGIDYVRVFVANDTEQVIPKRLEEDLLNLNPYGLDNHWIKYHTTPVEDIKYDYEIQVNFRDILVSPEEIREKEVIKERQVKDGYTYLEDEAGNLVKDSLGNEIKVDRMKTVRCKFHTFTQFKAAKVEGQVSYFDLNTQQVMNTFPLSTEFVFEHRYASYQGDRRALDTDLFSLTQLVAVPFPTDEQMIFDAGEDLKMRLKDIVTRHRFH